jgi:uncharacterized iron-regulated protein
MRISQRISFILGILIGFSPLAQAQGLPADQILKGGIDSVTLESALAGIKPGQVVVLGEQHGTSVQAAQQLQVLETIKNSGHLISLGMEFFDYTKQSFVDRYQAGQLDEATFLTQVGWGQGFSYDAYRNQVQFPQFGSEYVIALNAPRTLTSRISRVGMAGLTEDEKNLLPPGWTLGNQGYFERFETVMGGHVPPDALARYFEAQSTWDDTMAWKASEFLRAHPEQVLVIIVGEFHVQYGGGLPDRLKARGLEVTTFSLVNLEGLTESEQKTEVEPSTSYGSRADYVWTSRFSLER